MLFLPSLSASISWLPVHASMGTFNTAQHVPSALPHLHNIKFCVFFWRHSTHMRTIDIGYMVRQWHNNSCWHGSAMLSCGNHNHDCGLQAALCHTNAAALIRPSTRCSVDNKSRSAKSDHAHSQCSDTDTDREGVQPFSGDMQI